MNLKETRKPLALLADPQISQRGSANLQQAPFPEFPALVRREGREGGRETIPFSHNLEQSIVKTVSLNGN